MQRGLICPKFIQIKTKYPRVICLCMIHKLEYCRHKLILHAVCIILHDVKDIYKSGAFSGVFSV